MQLCIRRLTLALFVGVLAMATMASAQIKLSKCCTEIGTEVITAKIIGYRIQRKAPPCVRAVIFETEDGEVCSHWKQDWVFEKIKEVEQARKAKKNTTLAPTTSKQ